MTDDCDDDGIVDAGEIECVIRCCVRCVGGCLDLVGPPPRRVPRSAASISSSESVVSSGGGGGGGGGRNCAAECSCDGLVGRHSCAVPLALELLL